MLERLSFLCASYVKVFSVPATQSGLKQRSGQHCWAAEMRVMLPGFAQEGAVPHFPPPLSLGMEVGVLPGPGKVKGLQQECERHRKSGALER